MENQGWIRLHRKSLESSIWDNPIFWKVWCWCLMKAAHKKQMFPFNNQDIEIHPGQFVTGRDKAANQLNMTPQQYRTAMGYLKSTSRLTTQPTNRFTIITILNWDLYQNNKVVNQQTNQQLTNHQPATNQPLTTYKNVKNVKNDKNKDLFASQLKNNFDEARKIYPGTKLGLDTEFSNFTRKYKDWRCIVPLLKSAVQNQIIWHKEDGRWWKNFQTWINNACWEEERGEHKETLEEKHARMKAEGEI